MLGECSSGGWVLAAPNIGFTSDKPCSQSESDLDKMEALYICPNQLLSNQSQDCVNEDQKGSFPILCSPGSKDVIIDSSLLECVSQQGFPKGPSGQP